MADISKEELIQVAMESSPAGVIMTDASGTIIYCNPKIEAIFGYKKDELINQKVEVLVPGYIKSRHASMREDYMKHPEPRALSQRGALTAQHKNGSEIFVEIGLNPVEISNKKHVVASIIDLTEAKKNLIALKKSYENLEIFNKELESFAYICTKDLQEPMRKIESFAEFLIKENDENLSEETQNYILKIVNYTKTMKQLLNGLLDYSKLTTEREAHTVVDLGEIVSQVIKSYETEILETKAEIQVEGLTKIKAASRHMFTLFQQLIGNALKFHRKDESPKVQIRGREESGNHIIEIQDNGMGFDMKFQDSIFEMFNKLQTKEKFHGFGIGLAICKKIVLQHVGKISVQSSSDSGTTFRIELPFETDLFEFEQTISENNPEKTN